VNKNATADRLRIDTNKRKEDPFVVQNRSIRG
jgi:hypothetical protein